MTQEAHNGSRNPRFARHSTTAVGLPILHEGFGRPIISQQRGSPQTVDELSQQPQLQDAEVIRSLPSGQHADPFAVYRAFAGNFDETGEVSPAVLVGVSKGRCLDCDDALGDFPVIMDENYTLGKSTKRWKHASREETDSEQEETDSEQEES